MQTLLHILPLTGHPHGWLCHHAWVDAFGD